MGRSFRDLPVSVFALAFALSCGGDATKDSAPGGGDAGAGSANGGGADSSSGQTGDGSTGSPGSVADATDPLYRIVDSYCARQQACSKDLNIALDWADIGECRRSSANNSWVLGDPAYEIWKADHCAQDWPATTADEEEVDACLTRISEVDCGTLLFLESVEWGLGGLEYLGACVRAFTSMKDLLSKDGEHTVAIEGACEDDHECVMGSYCNNADVSEKNPTNQCTRRLAAGATCVRNENVDLCVEDQACDDSGHCAEKSLELHFKFLPEGSPCADSVEFESSRQIECEGALRCVDGRCTSASLGSKCTDYRECEYCRDGRCVQPKLGSPCEYDERDCLAEHACIDGVCTEVALCAGKGDSCSYSCANDLVCSGYTESDNGNRDGRCVEAGGLGEPCQDATHGNCADGLRCFSSKCEQDEPTD